LRAEQQNKTKEKSCEESPNMSKVINVGQHSNGKIDDDNEQQCEQSSSLKNAERGLGTYKCSVKYTIQVFPICASQ